MTDPDIFGYGEALVEAAPAPSDTDLQTVAELVKRLAAAQREKVRLEEELKAANILVQQLSEVDLPDALLAVGHVPPSKETIAGYKIDFSERFRCGQLDNQSNPEGFEWLGKEGHGDLAKHTITVTLPREMEEAAAEVQALIRSHRASNQFKTDYKATVAWNTLSSFAKEQLEHGVDVPLDTLKVTRLRQVKVIS